MQQSNTQRNYYSQQAISNKSPNNHNSKGKINNIRNAFNELMEDVTEKKQNQIFQIKQKKLTEDQNIKQTENLQQQQYIEFLQNDILEMKRKLNQEIQKNNLLMKKICLKEDESSQKYLENPQNSVNLELQNKALKTRIIKVSEEYDNLYQELDILKQQNKKLRNQTAQLLAKK